MGSVASMNQGRIAALTRRGVVSVSGEDAASFLGGLITNDVEALPEGGAGYGGLLSPQGKILFDFFVVKAPGLLSNPQDPRSLLPLVDLAKVAELEATGAIQGGMRPKIAAARSALAAGVASVHIVSGTLSDAILAEVFTNEGSGTMFVAESPRAPIS